MESTTRYAEANLPTEHGLFRVIVYRVGTEEHVAMVRGKVAGKTDVLARIHSECFTSETLGSLRCDCRLQLDHAFERIAAAECGVLIHLRQEGRGIGLGNKIRAYALQDQGVDTVEANLALGFEADLRHYEVAIAILRDLKVASIRLMTNNPLKIDEVKRAGIEVSAHEPHWVEATEHTFDYLKAKKIKMGHIVPSEE